MNDVNPIDGYTGLHYAADTGSEEVLRYLLQEHKAGESGNSEILARSGWE